MGPECDRCLGSTKQICEVALQDSAEGYAALSGRSFNLVKLNRDLTVKIIQLVGCTLPVEVMIEKIRKLEEGN